MGVLVAVTSIASSLMITPFLMLILCIIFFASLLKSLGIRRLYIKFLLKIFEYGRQNIESAQQIYNITDDELHDNNSIKCQNTTDNDLKQKDDTEYINGGVNINLNNINNKENNINIINDNENINKNGELLTSPLNNGNTVISRDALILFPNQPQDDNSTNCNDKNIILLNNDNITDVPITEDNFEFNLENCLDYVKAGVEAIIEDEVTSRFEAEELKNWNLLTRTNRHYEFISWRLTVIWVCGFFVRYIVLMPLRVFICFLGVSWTVIAMTLIGFINDEQLKRIFYKYAFRLAFLLISRSLSAFIIFHNIENRPKNCGFCVANHTSPIDVAVLSTDCIYSMVCWLTLCTAIVGFIPDSPRKRWMIRLISIHCFGFLSCALSAVINYHNNENRPLNGICVANHTSPIDVLVLMCDNCYSLIGQRHGGFLGILQRALGRASPHIWFERAEAKDRSAVARRLKEHITVPNNPPILIFPEGTCINNTSVMQFKKGSFEVGGVIYPVAIKYDNRFGDPFWNSSRYSMMQHLFMMMTSWAIVCDVWYLPPMYRHDGESAIDFANRVKSVIAKQGGLIDLMWDGQLKRMKPKKEWKEKQQQEFTKRLKGE